MIFVLSIFEWSLKTGFTVRIYILCVVVNTWLQERRIIILYFFSKSTKQLYVCVRKKQL